MHLWVIFAEWICHGLFKKLHAPDGDRTADPSIQNLALYHVAIKADFYHKAVQVYGIPIFCALWPLFVRRLSARQSVWVTRHARFISLETLLPKRIENSVYFACN